MREEENYFDNINDLFVQAFETDDDVLLESLQFEGDNFVDYQPYSEGGIKQISLCTDRRTGRRVAMATLKNSTDPQKTKAFLREAKVNAALQHPNIVPIYEMGINQDTPWFAMKFIAGKSLADIISKTKKLEAPDLDFPLNQRLDIFMKVCDAIAYAHSIGILHLDIKPDNIRISDYGDVVLCDWGLADIEATSCDERLLEFCTILEHDLNHQTLDGSVKGTPGYMAPEQTSMVKIRKGRHTDIFSLGTLLYALLTLEKPFKGYDLKNIIENTAKCKFIKPHKLRKAIPESLEAVCLKAMQFKPEDRYKSANELKREIEAYRNGFATYAENASFFKLLRLLIYRRKIISALSLGLFILIPILVLAFIHNQELSKKFIEEENKKLILEQELFRQRGKDSAPLFLEQAEQSLKIFALDSAMHFCNEAIKRDSQLTKAWKLKALLHFANENYQLCVESFKKVNIDVGRLYKLANVAQNLKMASTEKSQLSVRKSILQRLHKVKDMPTFSLLLHSIVHKEMPIEDRLDLCRFVIDLRNNRPKNKPFNLSYDPMTQTLDISNNPWIKIAHCLQNFPAITINASNTSISRGSNFNNSPVKSLNISNTQIVELRTLTCKNLKELNISGNIIHNIDPLEKYPLISLDISYTPIKYLNFIPKLPFLKELTVHKGQFTKTQFRWKTDNLKIIIKSF
jgi:eukaryotic-like serine/threonine-protein kinase